MIKMNKSYYVFYKKENDIIKAVDLLDESVPPPVLFVICKEISMKLLEECSAIEKEVCILFVSSLQAFSKIKSMLRTARKGELKLITLN